MNTIRTMQNDTWDKISLRVYGSENFMDKLIEANMEHRKKIIFNSEDTVNVPDIDTEAALVNKNLPPWKL